MAGRSTSGCTGHRIHVGCTEQGGWHWSGWPGRFGLDMRQPPLMSTSAAVHDAVQRYATPPASYPLVNTRRRCCTCSVRCCWPPPACLFGRPWRSSPSPARQAGCLFSSKKQQHQVAARFEALPHCSILPLLLPVLLSPPPPPLLLLLSLPLTHVCAWAPTCAGFYAAGRSNGLQRVCFLRLPGAHTWHRRPAGMARAPRCVCLC